MNEIKRQLQMKIGDTAQQQRNVMQKINEQYPMREKKKKSFFTVAASLALLVATCLFVFSFIGEEELSTSTMNAVPIPMAGEFNMKEVLTPITEEQKQQYYQQYVEIVEKVIEKKIGISIGVAPIEEFKESDWVEPAEFEKRIQSIEEGFLAEERETIAAVSTDLKPAVTNPNGETTKATYLYFNGLVKKFEVTALFDTQYNADKSRQLFSNVDEILTKIAGFPDTGEWEQTFQKVTLLDGGRTYSIYIEGIFDYMDIQHEKVFTIEFYCDEFGNIY